VAVSDLDAAISFYHDTYAMTLMHEEINQEQGVREAMMTVGASGPCIQLLAPLSPDSTIALSSIDPAPASSKSPIVSSTSTPGRRR
jgi:hypothetical protein